MKTHRAYLLASTLLSAAAVSSRSGLLLLAGLLFLAAGISAWRSHLRAGDR